MRNTIADGDTADIQRIKQVGIVAQFYVSLGPGTLLALILGS
jgi:uncharacterized membrane-anchored protein